MEKDLVTKESKHGCRAPTIKEDEDEAGLCVGGESHTYSAPITQAGAYSVKIEATPYASN